jgi:hypothetical protein
MKSVNSYKCSYCDKLYESKDSCRSHESRCYFNPKTKSCASCAFLKYDSYEYKPHYTCSVKTCMKNHDVTGKLKTKCDDYFFKNAIGSAGKIEQAETTYNPIPQVEKYLKKIGLQVETNLTVSSSPDIEIGLYDDEYLSSLTNAYLDKLVSAVGYKILFLVESEFSNKHDLLTDQELDMHFNLQHEEIDDVISLFSYIGIPAETIHNLIKKISGKLPKTLDYAYPLIAQSEVSHNTHLAEAYEWIGDEGSANYYQKKASKAGKMIGIDTIFNDSIQNRNINSLPNEKDSVFHENCLKMITEIYPNLRNEIIDGLKEKNTSEAFNASGTPF